MIKFLYLLPFIFSITSLDVIADEIKANQKQLTTIKLNHISGYDVISVLNSLVDKSVSITEEENTLLINGTAAKTKNIIPIIEKIDTPPEAFTIEFIASNRKINLQQSNNTYESSSSITNTSQSMGIIERQWVTLNTGLSVPVTERRRLADGTETQSFRYKNVSKSYLFKVHEFSGWSVIQVGVNNESLSENIAGAIEYTKLNTTIIGKTGEWLKVASKKPISDDVNTKTYTTNQRDNNRIYLYVKVIKPDSQNKK